MWRYRYPEYICHSGRKGMKWGVRRGPPYPIDGHKSGVDKSGKRGILKITMSGHKDAPRKAEPNSVIDHVSNSGKVTSRSYYDENGLKSKDIHTTDHGNPKPHAYGKHGEHVHEYVWNEDGSLKEYKSRELDSAERKENSDIL